MTDKRGRLFSKPAGPSEHYWNNMHMGTTGDITCEMCGTHHEEIDPSEASRIIDRFLGLQLIEECCGKTIDILYAEFGEEFFMQFLRDYEESPLDIRFHFTGSRINEALDKINKKALELSITSSTVRAKT